MKTYFYTIIILLICILSFNASSQALTKRYIKYTEHINTQESLFLNQGLPLKSSRVSSHSGNIKMFYDENLPDSIKIALTTAKTLWEAKIQNKHPFSIEVEFAPLDNGVAMIVEVGNYEIPDMQCCFPSALAYQILDKADASDVYADGYITINSNIDWTCSFSKESLFENNLTTTVLRGLARCLGFGTAIVEDEFDDNLTYYEIYPTAFDNLLFSNGKPLTKYLSVGNGLKEFATSENVWIHTSNDSLKIYAPSKYVANESLCYFDNENSLMSHSLSNGNISLAIDNKTVDVLNAIGWGTLIGEPEIKCSDILDDGIGSSYSSHTFTLSNQNESISNYDWKFFLKSREGNYELISECTTPTFTIDKIEMANQYYINLNGDLEGMIQCDYTVNEIVISTNPFKLSLELKPSIISVDNLTITPTGKYTFTPQFNVQYRGADYVTVEIEEEYNTTLRTYRFEEPFFAHITTGNITTLYYSWVTIIVSNKYGETYETLEFEPAYGILNDTEKTVINDYENANTDIIKNISYDYNIMENSAGTCYCEGTLKLGVDIPKDAVYVELQRGHSPQNVHESGLFYSSRCQYEVDSKLISRDRIRDNEFFRLYIEYPDNHSEYTHTLFVKDYISTEDLEKINKTTDLSATDFEDVKIFKIDNNLIIKPSKTIYVMVSDLMGNQIYTGDVSNYMEIPIDKCSSPIIVVNISGVNNFKTFKILNK